MVIRVVSQTLSYAITVSPYGQYKHFFMSLEWVIIMITMGSYSTLLWLLE